MVSNEWCFPSLEAGILAIGFDPFVFRCHHDSSLFNLRSFQLFFGEHVFGLCMSAFMTVKAALGPFIFV